MNSRVKVKIIGNQSSHRWSHFSTDVAQSVFTFIFLFQYITEAKLVVYTP